MGSWSFPEWITVIGLPITLFTAAGAALGVRRIQQRLADHNIVMLLSGLQYAAKDLERAVTARSTDLAEAAIGDWRGNAVQVVALLEKRKRPCVELKRLMHQANGQMIIAQDELRSTDDPAGATAYLRQTISQATDEARAILGEMRAFTG